MLLYPTQAYSLKRWTSMQNSLLMYTANHHVAMDTFALKRFGPRYLSNGKMYNSVPENVSLQPSMLALRHYLKKCEVPFSVKDLEDREGLTTIDLDEMRELVVKAFPTKNAAIDVVFTRIDNHLKKGAQVKQDYM